MSDYPLNSGYIKTKPGLFKAISVVVGLFTVAFTAAAFDGGLYYHKPTCFGSGLSPGGCFGDGTYKFCKEVAMEAEKYQDLKEKVKSLISRSNANPNQLTRKDLDLVDDLPTSCPYPWLVVLPMALIIITWLISLIMLIIQLVVDLNQKFPGFLKFDFILHFVYTCVMLISVLLLVAFSVWALAGKYPCTQRLYDNRGKFYMLKSALDRLPSRQGRSKDKVHSSSKGAVGFNKDQPSGNSRGFHFRGGYFYDDCAKETEATYKLGLLITGLVCAIGTLVLYGILIMILNDQYKRGNPRAPTQRSGGQQPQQQTQFSSQSSVDPNSPSQASSEQRKSDN